MNFRGGQKYSTFYKTSFVLTIALLCICNKRYISGLAEHMRTCRLVGTNFWAKITKSFLKGTKRKISCAMKSYSVFLWVAFELDVYIYRVRYKSWYDFRSCFRGQRLKIQKKFFMIKRRFCYKLLMIIKHFFENLFLKLE